MLHGPILRTHIRSRVVDHTEDIVWLIRRLRRRDQDLRELASEERLGDTGLLHIIGRVGDVDAILNFEWREAKYLIFEEDRRAEGAPACGDDADRTVVNGEEASHLREPKRIGDGVWAVRRHVDENQRGGWVSLLDEVLGDADAAFEGEDFVRRRKGEDVELGDHFDDVHGFGDHGATLDDDI